MKFVPSQRSFRGYGDGELPTDTVMSEEAPAAGPKISASNVIDIITIAKSALGLDSDDRETAATMKAKIQITKTRIANNALPGAWYWRSQLAKQESLLPVLEAKARSEATEVLQSNFRDLGYTVAVWGGVSVVVLFAAMQMQKVRLRSLEVRKAKRELEDDPA